MRNNNKCLQKKQIPLQIIYTYILMANIFEYRPVQDFSSIVGGGESYKDGRYMVNGFLLLTRSQFEILCAPPPQAQPMRTAAKAFGSEYRTGRDLTKLETDTKVSQEAYMKGIIDRLAEALCRDIQVDYGKNAVASAMGPTSEYDILVAIKASDIANIEKIADIDIRTNAIIDYVCGIIIVQKGECLTLPTAWCVNLICVKPGTISGKVLMGALLYCINMLYKPGEYPGCLLELANGFFNLSGYYSYTSSGYTVDESLFSAECFHNPGCVTMKYDMVPGRDNVADIIARVIGRYPDGRPLEAITDAPYNLLIPDRKAKLLWLSNIIQKDLDHPNKDKLIFCRDQISRRLDILFKLRSGDLNFDKDEKKVLTALNINKPTIPIETKMDAVQASIEERWVEFNTLSNARGGGRKKTRSKKTRGKKTRGKKTRSKKTRRRRWKH